MANLIALCYNWWNLCLRFYDEGHHREAIHTRPMLMAGVGRQVQSRGQRTVKISIFDEKGDHIAQAVTRISKELHQIRATSERWTVIQRWTQLLTRLLRRWLGGKWLPGLPEEARLLLSGHHDLKWVGRATGQADGSATPHHLPDRRNRAL